MNPNAFELKRFGKKDLAKSYLAKSYYIILGAETHNHDYRTTKGHNKIGSETSKRVRQILVNDTPTPKGHLASQQWAEQFDDSDDATDEQGERDGQQDDTDPRIGPGRVGKQVVVGTGKWGKK